MKKIQVSFLEEAKSFLKSLPIQAYKKILYNVDRVAGGEKNTALFKKLENSEIWEFRTLYNGISYRLFAFWDTESKTLVVATRHCKENAKDTEKRDSQGGDDNATIL